MFGQQHYIPMLLDFPTQIECTFDNVDDVEDLDNAYSYYYQDDDDDDDEKEKVNIEKNVEFIIEDKELIENSLK